MVRNSKLLTARQARELDCRSRESLGISTLILMENAGRQVAGEALGLLGAHRPIAILCGRGNNGADGFVAARQLLARGVRPRIFLAGRISEVKGEARVNLDMLLKLKEKIIQANDKNLHRIKSRIIRCGLIIDALLGVGLEGEVRGIYRGLIEVINASRAYVLSVDIPSGLDATSGKVLGCCVKADKTVTFIARKRGMLVGDGPKYCGKIIVKDLGIPI